MKSWQKTSRFPMVRFLNGWDHTYSPILWKPAHLKSSLQMFPDFEWYVPLKLKVNHRFFVIFSPRKKATIPLRKKMSNWKKREIVSEKTEKKEKSCQKKLKKKRNRVIKNWKKKRNLVRKNWKKRNHVRKKFKKEQSCQKFF